MRSQKESSKKIRRKVHSKGITITTLVISIIVLIILASIGISLFSRK